MIEIWEPRYNDDTLLVATWKIKPGVTTEVKITNGYYSGKYRIPWDVIQGCKVEKKPTKSGRDMDFTVVPLEKLEKVDD